MDIDGDDDDDDDNFNLIQPTLFQQIKTILDQYPDDGQILKVKYDLGLRINSSKAIKRFTTEP